MEITKKNVFRGWLAYVILVFCNLLLSGMVSTQAGLLLVPFTQDLGITRTLFASMTSIIPIANICFSLLFAKCSDTIGVKWMTVIGTAAGLGYALALYLAGSIPGAVIPLLIVAHILLGLAMSWATVMTTGVVVNNWFGKNRGLLISISSTATMLSSTVFAPIIANIISNSGWQASLLFRIVILAVFLVLVIIGFRAAPKDGESKLWPETEDTVNTGDTAEVSDGLTLAEARHTVKFWLLLVMFVLVGGCCYPVTTVIAAFANDVGLPEAAGMVSSMLFGTGVVLALILGPLMEKLGTRVSMIGMFALQILSMILLATNTGNSTMLCVGAALAASGQTMSRVPLPILVRDLFGARDFAKIQSIIYSSMIAGMVAGPPVFNRVFDTFGSYKPAFIGSIVVLACLMLITFFMTKGESKAK